MNDFTRNATLVNNYRSNGFMQPLQFGRRPALIIIDFVKAYLIEGSPLYGGQGIRTALDGAIKLLAAARAAAIPIFHTNLGYDSGSRNGGVLEPAAGESVITKQYSSAFFGTTLASTLTAMGVDTLIIAGVSTSGCVRASGVDCCQYGFIPMVVRDAVGDRAPEPHEANLFDLQAKYAEVVDLGVATTYLGTIRAHT